MPNIKLLDECIDWNQKEADRAEKEDRFDDRDRFYRNIDELEKLKREINDKQSD